MILITKNKCPSCEIVKRRINGKNIEIIDADSVDAMVELSYLGLYGNGQILSVPFLITDDNKTISGDVNRIIEAIENV